MPEAVTLHDLRSCARCGEYHVDVVFRPFGRPVETNEPGGNATHWAPCPVTGDPILLGAV